MKKERNDFQKDEDEKQETELFRTFLKKSKMRNE